MVRAMVSINGVQLLSPVNTLALSLIALAGGAELRVETLRSVARAYVEAYRFAKDGGGSTPMPPARGGTKTGKTIKRTDAPYEKTLHA